MEGVVKKGKEKNELEIEEKMIIVMLKTSYMSRGSEENGAQSREMDNKS